MHPTNYQRDNNQYTQSEKNPHKPRRELTSAQKAKKNVKRADQRKRAAERKAAAAVSSTEVACDTHSTHKAWYGLNYNAAVYDPRAKDARKHASVGGVTLEECIASSSRAIAATSMDAFQYVVDGDVIAASHYAARVGRPLKIIIHAVTWMSDRAFDQISSALLAARAFGAPVSVLFIWSGKMIPTQYIKNTRLAGILANAGVMHDDVYRSLDGLSLFRVYDAIIDNARNVICVLVSGYREPGQQSLYNAVFNGNNQGHVTILDDTSAGSNTVIGALSVMYNRYRSEYDRPRMSPSPGTVISRTAMVGNGGIGSNASRSLAPLDVHGNAYEVPRTYKHDRRFVSRPTRRDIDGSSSGKDELARIFAGINGPRATHNQLHFTSDGMQRIDDDESANVVDERQPVGDTDEMDEGGEKWSTPKTQEDDDVEYHTPTDSNLAWTKNRWGNEACDDKSSM